MQYRIELSTTRKGAAQVHLPGRRLDLEVTREEAPAWQVCVKDSLARRSGIVELRAANAGDAVWRVARAAVKAVSELTHTPLDASSGGSPLLPLDYQP